MAVRPIDKTKPSNQRCWNCKHFRDARVIEEGPYIESRKFYCETSSNVVRYWSCCSYFEWDPDKQYEHPTLTPPNEPLTLEHLRASPHGKIKDSTLQSICNRANEIACRPPEGET